MTVARDPTIDSLGCKLMNLPPEIRNSIYHHAFTLPRPLRLRSPSHRRLRPSRIRKDDPRGFLDTSQSIRNEGISVFYGVNPLVFHSADECIEFILDSTIHRSIRSSVRHVTVDFGDIIHTTLDGLFYIIDQMLIYLPALQTIETRYYTRNSDSRSHLDFMMATRLLQTIAKSIDALSQSTVTQSQTDEDTSTTSSLSSPSSSLDPMKWKQLGVSRLSKTAARRIRTQAFKFNVSETSEEYPIDRENKDTLVCCNLSISTAKEVELALGPASEAVKDRVAKVGVLPLKIFEMYEYPTAEDNNHHPRACRISQENRWSG